MTASKVYLSAGTLAEMIAQVGEPLLGCSLKSYRLCLASLSLTQIPLNLYSIAFTGPGDHFDVVMGCTSSHAQTLADRMIDTSKPTSAAMVQDALSEWLNILAGQIKSLAALDHEMGLPRASKISAENSIKNLGTTPGLEVELSGLDVVLWLGLVGSSNVILGEEG